MAIDVGSKVKYTDQDNVSHAGTVITFSPDGDALVTLEGKNNLIKVNKNNLIEIIINIGTDVSDTTAVADDVLSGKDFYLADGTKTTGTIQSKSAQTYIPTTADQTIAAGQYLSGAQTVKGDANLVAENIKKDVTIFGVTGSYEGGGGTPDPYVTFSSPTSFTMGKTNGKTWDGTVEYSTDASTWTTWNGTDTLTAVSDSGTYYIYLRGISNTGWGRSSSHDPLALTGSNISVAGNIETLLDYATVALGNHPQMAQYCFKSLLRSNTALVSAENLEFPAPTLTDYCYQSVFNGCSNLVTAPTTIAATTTAMYSHFGMFYQCTSLVNPPALPATTLADNCYNTMFCQCTSLVSAPALPATTLVDNCYYSMFYACASLVSAPALPATTLANGCYQQMFFGCSSLKISSTQEGEYQYAYRIPTEGTGTTAANALVDMFTWTYGTFTGTPSINTTYYTDHAPVLAS